jgi:hypothetical protein
MKLMVDKCGWCKFGFGVDRSYGSTLHVWKDSEAYNQGGASSRSFPICKTCTTWFLAQEEKRKKVDVKIVLGDYLEGDNQ